MGMGGIARGVIQCAPPGSGGGLCGRVCGFGIVSFQRLDLEGGDTHRIDFRWLRLCALGDNLKNQNASRT
jgi:hypothetical protein